MWTCICLWFPFIPFQKESFDFIDAWTSKCSSLTFYEIVIWKWIKFEIGCFDLYKFVVILIGLWIIYDFLGAFFVACDICKCEFDFALNCSTFDLNSCCKVVDDESKRIDLLLLSMLPFTSLVPTNDTTFFQICSTRIGSLCAIYQRREFFFPLIGSFDHVMHLYAICYENGIE